MSDANIWMPLVGILYVIPVFWMMNGFYILRNMAGNRWLAVAWVLCWPVFMIVDMMSNDSGEQ